MSIGIQKTNKKRQEVLKKILKIKDAARRFKKTSITPPKNMSGLMALLNGCTWIVGVARFFATTYVYEGR